MYTSVSRRWLVGCAVLLLWGCGDEPPPRRYEPPNYAYLTPLRIKVASIDIDDNWVPTTSVPDIAALSPVRPIDALRQMGQDRLIAVGNGGHATFRIVDAGINRIGNQLQGHLGVELDIYTSDNTRTAYAEARVARASIITDPDIAGLRSALYDLTTQMMSDMNVEFEYQVRHSLRDWLQDTPLDNGPAVPAPVTQTPLDGIAPLPPPANAPPPGAPIPLAPRAPAYVPDSALPMGTLGTLPQSDLPFEQQAPTQLVPQPLIPPATSTY